MANRYDFTLPGKRPRGIGKNLYLLGTSEDGPYMEPTLIESKEKAREIFGSSDKGTLVKAFDQSYDNNRDISIFLMRITGKSATLEVEGMNYAEDEFVTMMTVKSIYAGSKYNEVSIETASLEMENNEGGFCIMLNTPDGLFAYEIASDSTIGELSRKVNEDCRAGKHTILISTEYPHLSIRMILADLDDRLYLSGGEDGLYESKDDMYIACDTAYTILTGQPIDVIVPVGLYVDDVHPAYLYGDTVYGSAVYSSNRDYLRLVDTYANNRVVTYHEQLIDFCRTQIRLGYMTHGVIGIRPLDQIPTNIMRDDSYILRIVETTAFRDRHGFVDFVNGYWVDKGLYISVVCSELIFNSNTPEEYYDNGAVRYASLLSGHFETTTNLSLGEDVILRYDLSDRTRSELTKVGIVCFRDSVRHGVVVHSGVSAALSINDYHNIANVRMVQLVIAYMNDAVQELYEDESVSDMRSIFLEELVKDRLQILSDSGVLTEYDYDIRFLTDYSNGEISIQMKTKYSIDGLIASAEITSGGT